MNLGKAPWKGLPDDPHTECGCYPSKYKESKNMITKPSPQEKVQAILDARQDVAEYLQSIGKIEVFGDFTKDEICGLIRAAQEGVQKSLTNQIGQGLEDQIPF